MTRTPGIDIPPPGSIDDPWREIGKLRKINQALMDQVERSMDQQGSAYSLFQTAINLERQIRRRTSELTTTLAQLERSNHELKAAKEVAERANLSKTQVLAAASHDVLQPLNAALLLMSSLSSLQHDDDGKRLCRQVEQSLYTMDTLLRDLLFMSRLDSGIQPEWQSVSLDELFASLDSGFAPMAQQKGLSLRCRGGGLHVHSDPTMLRRILQNIVGNAIRYTDDGGVLLAARACQDRVTIRIADTGAGIPEDQFEDIFVEFYRGHQQRLNSSAAEGLGLGLAIVARMVTLLNHQLRLNSRQGRGTCFSLTLLAARPAPAPLRDQRQGRPETSPQQMQSLRAGLKGRRVLLIENDMIALDAMKTLLERWGCELRLASSTAEALEALADRRWQPHCVVADQHLEGNDLGTETIKLVRTLAGDAVPAIIVTANPSKALAREAADTGIEVMLKPVKPAQLRALLAHMTQDDTR